MTKLPNLKLKQKLKNMKMKKLIQNIYKNYYSI